MYIGLALDSSKPEFMKKSEPKLRTKPQQTDVAADNGMFSIVTQQTMANRFASESDPLNLLSSSNFQPKTSSVYVMKVYPSSDT